MGSLVALKVRDLTANFSKAAKRLRSHFGPITFENLGDGFYAASFAEKIGVWYIESDGPCNISRDLSEYNPFSHPSSPLCKLASAKLATLPEEGDVAMAFTFLKPETMMVVGLGRTAAVSNLERVVHFYAELMRELEEAQGIKIAFELPGKIFLKADENADAGVRLPLRQMTLDERFTQMRLGHSELLIIQP